MTAARRAAWPTVLSWGICGLVVIEGAGRWLFPAPDRLLALMPPIGMLIALGIILHASWHARAGGTRLGWLLLATVLAITFWEAVATTHSSLAAVLMIQPCTVIVLVIAGILLALGPARIWAEQPISAASTLQRLLEGGIIGMAGLLVASRCVAAGWPGDPIEAAMVLRLIIDGMLLAGMIALLLTGRRLAAYLLAALAWRLVDTGHLLLLGTALPLTMLPWNVLALGAAYHAGPHPERAVAADLAARNDVWRGTWFTRLILVLGLLIALPDPTGMLTLLLALAATTVMHDSCLHLRHQALQRRRRAVLRRIVAAQQEAHRQDQHTVQALAKLIHDLAPPVQAVSSIADQLQRIAARRERESPRVLSERLGRHADHLEHMVHQLNALLRRQNATALLRRPIDAMPIAASVVESFQPLARRRGIDLSLALGTIDTRILGDAGALRRILDNLVSNAISATPGGGVIVVELWQNRAHPRELSIAVRDSGSGLSLAEQQHAFLPRQQPGAGPGLGLGLAIVAELVTQMGGRYGLTSKPGNGSSFWLRLPRD